MSLTPFVSLTVFLFVCLPAWLPASAYQPSGESFHCLRTTHTTPFHGRRGSNGKAGLNRDGDLMVPEPPVVNSNAGIPETNANKDGHCPKEAASAAGHSELKPRRGGGSAVSGLWHRISVKLHSEAGRIDQMWRQGGKQAVELWQAGRGQSKFINVSLMAVLCQNWDWWTCCQLLGEAEERSSCLRSTT